MKKISSILIIFALISSLFVVMAPSSVFAVFPDSTDFDNDDPLNGWGINKVGSGIADPAYTTVFSGNTSINLQKTLLNDFARVYMDASVYPAEYHLGFSLYVSNETVEPDNFQVLWVQDGVNDQESKIWVNTDDGITYTLYGEDIDANNNLIAEIEVNSWYELDIYINQTLNIQTYFINNTFASISSLNPAVTSNNRLYFGTVSSSDYGEIFIDDVELDTNITPPIFSGYFDSLGSDESFILVEDFENWNENDWLNISDPDVPDSDSEYEGVYGGKFTHGAGMSVLYRNSTDDGTYENTTMRFLWKRTDTSDVGGYSDASWLNMIYLDDYNTYPQRAGVIINNADSPEDWHFEIYHIMGNGIGGVDTTTLDIGLDLTEDKFYYIIHTLEKVNDTAVMSSVYVDGVYMNLTTYADATQNFTEIRVGGAQVGSSDDLQEYAVDYVEIFPLWNPIVYNSNVDILDHEGLDSERWVFANWKFYSFNATYGFSGADGNASLNISSCWLYMTDGLNSMTVKYDVLLERFYVHNGTGTIALSSGAVTESGEFLNVIFKIMFLDQCLDVRDIDIQMYVDDVDGNFDGWEIMEEDYFNLYVAGGFIGEEPTTFGNAGSIPNMGPLDLYAFNNSYAESSIIYRNLQHIKIDHTLQILGIGWQEFQIRYNIFYMTNVDGWIKGGEVYLNAEEVTIGTEVRINFTASFYSNDGLVNQTQVYFYHRPGGGGTGDPTETRYWIDLWYDTLNQSSVLGLRVNAYEFPIKDTADVWLRWLTGTNWGADDSLAKDATMYVPLLDSEDNLVYASEIKLVEVGCYLWVKSDPVTDQYVGARSQNAFALTRSPLESYLRGTETPPLDQTTMPKSPAGGWMYGLINSLSNLGDLIADSIGPGLLAFLDVLVDAIDSLFAVAGWENGFSTILSWIGSGINWLLTSMGYLVDSLGAFFSLLLVFGDTVVSTFVDILGYWIDMARILVSIMGDGLGTGIHIWNDLAMTDWIMLAAILYPIWLLFMWDEEGDQALITHITFVKGILEFFFNLFIELAQFVLNLVGRIIESIPVVE